MDTIGKTLNKALISLTQHLKYEQPELTVGKELE